MTEAANLAVSPLACTAMARRLADMLHALSQALGLELKPSDVDGARAIAAFTKRKRVERGQLAGGRDCYVLMDGPRVAMAHCPETGWLGVFYEVEALEALENACPQAIVEDVVLKCMHKLDDCQFQFAGLSDAQTSQADFDKLPGTCWRGISVRTSALRQGLSFRAYQSVPGKERLMHKTVLFEHAEEGYAFLRTHCKWSPGLLSELQPTFGDLPNACI